MDIRLDDIFNTNSSEKTAINTEDLLSDLQVSALLAKSSVPYSHRRIANNFVIMKRICNFQIIQPRISAVEKALLTKYNYTTLENTTITKANREITQLKEWATSTDDTLRTDSVELLKIREKELKFILSDNYINNANDELYNGFKAIDTYLTSITKFYR